eukprot:Sspe_Gene.12272::Locus_4174_Transcript_1_1_Confidence_1.000_Length_720::g.12272::m.12272
MVTRIAEEWQKATVLDVVHWRTPALSTLIFGGGLALYILLEGCGYTAVTLAARVMQLVLLSGPLYYMVHGRPSVSQDGQAFDCQPYIHNFFDAVRPTLARAAIKANKVCSWEDTWLSLSWFVYLNLLSYFGGWLTDPSVLLLMWVVAFTAPRLYESQRHVVDPKLQELKAQVDKKMASLRQWPRKGKKD